MALQQSLKARRGRGGPSVALLVALVTINRLYRRRTGGRRKARPSELECSPYLVMKPRW